tara:strand:+ start:132 stop:983 length:852 start_codon:yes stop_codon:yes gene_type:complete
MSTEPQLLYFADVLALSFITILGIIALKFNSITFSGLVASVVIGYIVMVIGGPHYLILLIIFFVSSSIFTKIQKKLNKSSKKHSSPRSYINILANGVTPTFLIILTIFLYDNYTWNSVTLLNGDINIIGLCFIGSIVVTTADTFSTEIGLINKSKPRLITNLTKYVSKGDSGGVTLSGLLASIFAGIIISLTVFFTFEIFHFSLFLIITLVGILGSLFDSILGATIQYKGQCVSCKLHVETYIHHNKPTIQLQGSKYITNNSVNFLSSIFGSILIIILVISLL